MEDDLLEEDFVGREEDMRTLKDAFKTHKFIGVFGIRAVGKSRLVKEFLKRRCNDIGGGSPNRLSNCLDERRNDVKSTVYRRKTSRIVVTEMRNFKTSQDCYPLYANLCAALGMQLRPGAIESEEWIPHLVERVQELSTSHEHVVFNFDNAEDVTEGPLHDGFMSLVVKLLRKVPNVKIFVTSTVKVMFSQIRRTCFSHELKPMTPSDASLLLRAVTGSRYLGEYEGTIVKLCEGLPLLILMAGSELCADGDLLTAQEMVELLTEYRLRTLSKEYYPEEDRIADVYRKFIMRLKPHLRDRLAILEYIPGSFSAQEAMKMLNYSSTALVKDEALVPVVRRHVVTYSSDVRRFNIQGVLRDVLNVFFTIRNIPEVRRRYAETFTEVMVRLSRGLEKADFAKTLAEFTQEQPNLRKLLVEVQYTKEDTFSFFIHVAEHCTVLIENYLTDNLGESERFYEGCLGAADLYGREDDKATVHLAMGSLFTNIKGNLPRGEESYRSAYSYMKEDSRTLKLATLYQRLGWNLHRQGRNEDALGFFQKSLDISHTSGPEYRLLSLQTMNSLGITLTVLGNFDEAEKYHFKSLKRRREIQGENHPSVGSTLNNIGVFYDQLGDTKNALEFYEAGYKVKRGAKLPAATMVYSLSNIANVCSSDRQFDRAHRLLDEAVELLEQQKKPNLDAWALIYDTRGKVFTAEKKFDDAEDMFKKSVEIREEYSPNAAVYFESLMHLAKAKSLQGKFSSSLKVSNKALEIKEHLVKTMPKNYFIAECLECMADVYKKTNNDDRYKETLEKIESELMRLNNLCTTELNVRKVEKISNQLKEIRKQLDNWPG